MKIKKRKVLYIAQHNSIYIDMNAADMIGKAKPCKSTANSVDPNKCIKPSIVSYCNLSVTKPSAA